MKKANVKKVLLMICAVVLICAVSVTGTLAYLKAQTSNVTNTFVAAGGGNIVDPNPNVTDAPAKDAEGDDETAVTNALASGFALLENEAEYNDTTNTYKLTTKRVTANDYNKLAPAMTVSKNPQVWLDIATDVKAYVFVKVTDTIGGEAGNKNITYEMNSAWNLVGGHTDLYCYQNAAQTGADGWDLSGVAILKDDEINVKNATKESPFVDTDTASTGMQLGNLVFEAYVCQAGGFATPAAAYAACFNPPVTP